MRETLCWMGSLAAITSKTYVDASRKFGHPSEFKSFLNALAESEKRLARALLKSAARIEKAGGRAIAPPSLKGSRELVEDSYSFLRSTLFTDEHAFLEGLLQCEYLKWNCLIAPISEGLRAGAEEPAAVLAASQSHKRRIERFLESIGHSSPAAFRFRASEPVWVERLLVVGDFDPEVLSILRTEGRVDLARTGRDAVEMLSDRYYALVMSETGLPLLDGIELCKRASRKYPGIEERFLFMYGSLTGRDRDFIIRKRIRRLKKRSRPEKVRSEAARILDR
ncbi:MAG: response regulator [Deltaproteobacteria bacterium]|nr:response regulator [Deltaproteobacteria bacterium]MCL4872648.1 response regulator [bacterium]